VTSEPGMASIRAVYRAYLTWAAARGCTRGAAETPDEFRRRLISACPRAEAETALLTNLYVAARYGGLPCSAADVRRAELAVGRLRTLGLDP